MGRNDTVLMLGLTVALFVIFSGQSQPCWTTSVTSKRQGLHLLPALVILATIFSFHQLRKRQDPRAESLGVARAAQKPPSARRRCRGSWRSATRWRGPWTANRAPRFAACFTRICRSSHRDEASG